MTPVMQTALIGLVWALSVSIVMFAAGGWKRMTERREPVEKEQEQIDRSVAYLCDGGRACGSSPGCYMNGGDCGHTVDISHAVNFEQIPLPLGACLEMYCEIDSKERTHDN